MYHYDSTNLYILKLASFTGLGLRLVYKASLLHRPWIEVSIIIYFTGLGLRLVYKASLLHRPWIEVSIYTSQALD